LLSFVLYAALFDVGAFLALEAIASAEKPPVLESHWNTQSFFFSVLHTAKKRRQKHAGRLV
jgi:hypothetical protein